MPPSLSVMALTVTGRTHYFVIVAIPYTFGDQFLLNSAWVTVNFLEI
jgi:hypothetical protein